MRESMFVFLAVIFSVLFLPGDALAVFDMALERGYNTIDFGAMKMGEEKTAAQSGSYEHQFSFTSDNGRTWYFKGQVLMPLTSGGYSIPPENFEWIADQVLDGQGILSANRGVPSGFSTIPVLIYTSSGTDDTGTEVGIRLRYKLKIPENQAAGAYNAHIRFMMMEEL